MLTIEMYVVCIVNINFAIVVRGISPYFCNVKSCTPLLTTINKQATNKQCKYNMKLSICSIAHCFWIF